MNSFKIATSIPDEVADNGAVRMGAAIGIPPVVIVHHISHLLAFLLHAFG